MLLDGYGLRDHSPARPAPYASDPVLVHRLTPLLHASFRPRLATTPLRFAMTSPPSGCQGDSHPRAVEHARHTKKAEGANRLLLQQVHRELRYWGNSTASITCMTPLLASTSALITRALLTITPPLAVLIATVPPCTVFAESSFTTLLEVTLPGTT